MTAMLRAAMGHTASAANADAASACASFNSALDCADAMVMASVFLFVLLAGLVCVRSVLGIILPVLAVLVMGVLAAGGRKGLSEADCTA